jgi:hypothetical protein
LDVGINVVEVIKEINQLLWPLRTDHEYITHVTESLSELVVRPVKCHLLKTFLKEIGNHR